MFIGFASDNTAGAHPRIIEAISRANAGFCRPYGFDEYCQEAEVHFHRLFGDKAEVFLALNGTGANVLCLRALVRPWQGIICTDVAHINTDEAGAPEWGAGSKLLPVPSIDGKMTPDSLDMYLEDIDNPHHSTPRAVSITQTTEKGSLYTVKEVRAIADKAHAHGMLVHMDGTRISNAVAALGCDINEITRDAGVDVLSFGGTKNGLLLGEAVVFFRPELAQDFMTLRKQSLQLSSKMRFVAAQFIEALKDGLWLENARHANDMAKYFARQLAGAGLSVREPAANAVFVCMDPVLMKKLMEDYYFYETDAAIHEVRLMCSFATTTEEIDTFVSSVKKYGNMQH